MGKQLLADEMPGYFTTLIVGRSMNLQSPCVEDIFIEDIACALAKLPRFNGHTFRPYSVAEHCLLGLEYVPAADRLEYLMHDASEAYLGDVTAPLKALLPEYGYFEAKWTQTIVERFNLRPKLPASVTEVDRRMRVTEDRDLRGRRPLWHDKIKPYEMRISLQEQSHQVVERAFLEAFDRLVSSTPGAKR